MKNTMKALIAGQNENLFIEEIPIPEPSACQALVRLQACGVCAGTDSKLISHHFKLFDTYPAVLGHEGVGEIVALGKDVTGLHLGDHVLLPFQEGMNGPYYSGWGAYAEYAVVHDVEALRQHGLVPGMAEFPEGALAQTVLSLELAADPVGCTMIVTFREVLSAIRRFGMRPNDPVVVFGAGPVGLCFIRFLRLLGVGPVIAIDLSKEKAAQALRMGADAALNSSACDLPSELHRLLPGGAAYVVDAVGSPAIIQQALGLIRPGGSICCYGISPRSRMELDWSDAPYNWSLIFQQWPSKREEGEAHRQVAAWIAAGALNPRDFISHTFDLDHALEAFELIAQRRPDTKKIVITF